MVFVSSWKQTSLQLNCGVWKGSMKTSKQLQGGVDTDGVIVGVTVFVGVTVGVGVFVGVGRATNELPLK